MTDILIVDDEEDIRDLVSEILKDEGFNVRSVGNSEDCMAELDARKPSVLLLDIWLKDSEMDGIDILKATRRNNPDIPILIISGHGNIEIAVAAIKQGAYDYVEKPFNTDQLLVVVKRAYEHSELLQENVLLKRGDAEDHSMIGQSQNFRAKLSQLEKVASSNARVMLSAGGGSGNELAARTIHKLSSRKAGPFIIVHCASSNSNKLEEILFGIEHDDKKFVTGLLEEAHEGTILFDEISELPMDIQQKLLRCLNEQCFERVGGQSKVNVEFILLIVCAVLIQGCSQINQVKDVKDGPGRDLDVSSIPDAIPRMEPITVAGNKNPYTVFGKTYHLLPSAEKYRQVGIASWYGTKFHGNPTSNGEIYDMYGMTGAHKTLPIPSYVRVTNLENNRSIVIRINDRGPVSYTHLTLPTKA